MIKQRFFATSLLTGLAALLAFSALALTGEQGDCTQKKDRGLRIGACTAIINSGEMSDAERAVAHFNRGSAHDGLGETAQAIEDYDAALLLAPEMEDAYYNRANDYFMLDDHARAIEDYDQAVRIDPTAAHAYNNRGEAHSRLGDEKQAIEDFSQALRIDPGYADAYRNRGVVYEIIGQYENAVNDWEREIALGGAERAQWWREYLIAKGHYSSEIDSIDSPAGWAALTACAVDPDC
jgi:tetratricopeptide (TPR) repeat protein